MRELMMIWESRRRHHAALAIDGSGDVTAHAALAEMWRIAIQEIGAVIAADAMLDAAVESAAVRQFLADERSGSG
jgi:hypothetical protein